ncbi:MAG: hypothetical protein ACKPFD_16705 [Dolichospermum sp.]
MHNLDTILKILTFNTSAESAKLEAIIRENLRGLGYNIERG